MKTHRSAADVRRSWSETIDSAIVEPVWITRNGRETVALMNASLAHEALTALEDARDTSAAQAALAEDGESIPWDDVKAELGLTD